jgi:hypothetical protein
MFLFTYGPNSAPSLEDAHPLHEGEDAGRMTQSGRVAWIYCGF